MNVRGKFNIQSIELFTFPKGGGQVKMSAVYDSKTPENNSYSEATPSGEIKMMVSNPAAFAVFKAAFDAGQSIYCDFTVAESS